MFSILQRIFLIVLEPLRHNKADRRIEKEIFALIHAIVFEYTSPLIIIIIIIIIIVVIIIVIIVIIIIVIIVIIIIIIIIMNMIDMIVVKLI